MALTVSKAQPHRSGRTAAEKTFERTARIGVRQQNLFLNQFEQHVSASGIAFDDLDSQILVNASNIILSDVNYLVRSP